VSQKSDFKILVVDDEKDIVLLLKYNLETQGYYVKTASSGKDALQLAEKINSSLTYLLLILILIFSLCLTL